MSSYILITRKVPVLLKKLPASETKFSAKPISRINFLPSPSSGSRYFLSLLAFWACINLSIFFLPSLLPFPGHLHSVSEFWNRPAAINWTWAVNNITSEMEPCLNFTDAYHDVSSLRKRIPRDNLKYMMVVVSGGLNQQRNQIIDAVIIARILGAALVVPVLQVNQVWSDDSEFGDIFDERHFKETLRDDVTIFSILPTFHLRSRRIRSSVMPFGADEEWVRTNYMPKLGRNVVFVLRAFDSRLSHNFSTDLQKLRCKVAFKALRFQTKIEETAEMLVRKMSQRGPYVSLHLRLEKDVWVRTGCLPGLGKEIDFDIKRERALNPKLLTSRSKLTPEQRYLAGYCPLNAREISWMLRGLGFSRSTRIYWAGGEPFGGDNALKPLRKQFSNLYNKRDLARSGELKDFEHKPSLLAAIDYVVCLRSEVFIANHGGNMARALQGHRTYMHYGENIKPNKKLLVRLFMNRSLKESDVDYRIREMYRNSLESVIPRDA